MYILALWLYNAHEHPVDHSRECSRAAPLARAASQCDPPTDTTPVGVAVDATIRRLFFAQPIQKFIASINYDGSGFDVAVNTSRDLDQPFDIALDPATR